MKSFVANAENSSLSIMEGVNFASPVQSWKRGLMKHTCVNRSRFTAPVSREIEGKPSGLVELAAVLLIFAMFAIGWWAIGEAVIKTYCHDEIKYQQSH